MFLNLLKVFLAISILFLIYVSHLPASAMMTTSPLSSVRDNNKIHTSCSVTAMATTSPLSPVRDNNKMYTSCSVTAMVTTSPLSPVRDNNKMHTSCSGPSLTRLAMITTSPSPPTVLSHDSRVFKFLLSATAAVIAESVTYPLDLTKTRLQIQGEAGGHVLTTPQAHRGMLATAFGIVREEGLRKLWQGVTPALYRHVIYTGCRMSFYEIFRDQVFKVNSDGSFPVWKASLSGLLAGALGQFVSSPTDLVKVHMQMEGRRKLEGKSPRVKNTVDAFLKIAAEGGVRGLWRGWVPNVQRAALVNLGDLSTYDTAKHAILYRTSLQDNYVTHTLASACSGLVAALMGTPADVIKSRIMNQPTQEGKGMLYSGSVDCLVKTVRQEGFFSLYKGLLPIWARMAPWSLVFWLSYEKMRRLTGTSSF